MASVGALVAFEDFGSSFLSTSADYSTNATEGVADFGGGGGDDVSAAASSSPSPSSMASSSGGSSGAEINPVFVEVVVPWLFGLICVVGLVGNALVVLVVSCNPQMRSTTNMLIINLAIADLLFIVFCVPFTATDYGIGYWPFGDVWCRTVQYFINVSAYASIYTLVLMSLDRYLAVVHPITSMQLRVEKNSIIACALLWLAILVICIPVAFIHGTNPGLSEHEVYCTFDMDNYDHNLYQVVFSLTSFFAPLSVIFALYVLILNRLWLRARSSAESVRSRRRVTRLVVVVVLTFAVCWAPIQVILFLKSMQMIDVSSSMTLLVLQICSQVLAYTNSCLNPILYAFLSENFRKAFRKLIFCGSRDSGSMVNQAVGVNQASVLSRQPRGSTVITTTAATGAATAATTNGHKGHALKCLTGGARTALLATGPATGGGRQQLVSNIL